MHFIFLVKLENFHLDAEISLESFVGMTPAVEGWKYLSEAIKISSSIRTLDLAGL